MVVTLFGITILVKLRHSANASFVDFVDAEGEISLLRSDILAENTHLYVVKSISKSYGVPGLRLGVLASGDTQTIARLKKEGVLFSFLTGIFPFFPFSRSVRDIFSNIQNSSEEKKFSCRVFPYCFHNSCYKRIFFLHWRTHKSRIIICFSKKSDRIAF